MFSPISPQTVYIIHKEKERELERQIEWARIAKERAGSGSSLEQRRPWFTQVTQWMKEKLSNRAPVREHASSQPELFEEPCPGIPC